MSREAAYWLVDRRLPAGEWLTAWRELLETAPPREIEGLYCDPRHIEARKQVRRDSNFDPPVCEHLAETARLAEGRSGIPLRRNRRRR